MRSENDRIPHSIQGLDSEVDGCEFLLVFDDGNFSEDSTFLLTDWLAHTPRDVLAKNFRTSEDKLQKLPSKELYIFPAPKPGALSEDRKSKARTSDYRGGDVGYVPFAMGHYIENTGSGPLRFLEMFRSERYADLSLNQWLALTPHVWSMPI